ncbi:RNA-directed DNA polymerase (Reverse transcriptase) [Cucumis melo var. makuwa]|uniref:RNA-directed DNA polymerase (Reverse transcriptase) n=1 Tax=Cucumis melo var. makuwa TaxID=1194695 RepID=A0A5A7UBV1_CUCMM|nr:RNA-directed DNA polymerase (Reverse transcriptase) [Cucumis melo var. makuwa]
MMKKPNNGPGMHLPKCSLISQLLEQGNLSALSGLNIKENELFEEASKLCKASHLPLSYLGLPLGGYPKQAVFWQPLAHPKEPKLAAFAARGLAFSRSWNKVDSLAMFKLCSGTRIAFWHDPWANLIPLKDSFPRLIRLYESEWGSS